MITIDFAQYPQRLARAFYSIEKRGLLVDTSALENLKNYILDEIDKNCDKLEGILGQPVAACKEPESGRRNVKAVAKDRNIKQDAVLNIASPKQLISLLENGGIKIPKKRVKTEDGYRMKESLDEESLLRIAMYNSQLKFPDIILSIRELNKMLGTYVGIKLYNNTLYTHYKVNGTDTGRRSAEENCFGYGGNGQNIPKHSALGRMLRSCLIARPGHILIEADQKGAEDWLVQGIIVDNGGSRRGLDELLSGINRHARLAGRIFNLDEKEIKKNKDAGMKYEIQYFCGKKTRHAGNYGMQEDTMSAAMLKEAHLNMPPAYTKWLLSKFHEIEPDIKGKFHAYVERELCNNRKLITPLGRERVFFDLRPGSSNSDVFRKAYAYIPQSSVGDNTGFAIIWLEERGYRVLADNHDAVLLEVRDNDEDILDAVQALKNSFHRVMRFPNGTEIEIPTEIQLGYNMRDLKGLPDCLDMASLRNILLPLRTTLLRHISTPGGSQQL